MPYPNTSFDLVVHSDVLEHIENPIQALKESRRVLRPGGMEKATMGFSDTGSDDCLIIRSTAQICASGLFLLALKVEKFLHSTTRLNSDEPRR